MGICWVSPANDPTPNTAGHLSSVISHTTSIAASSGTSGGSNISQNIGITASSGDEANPNGQISPAPNLRIFTFAELKFATKNFRSDMVLGEGCFGKVFKGWLDEKAPGKIGNGTLVAIKRLKCGGSQALKEWRSEINVLGRLSHPHLVKLLGYCFEDEELLLVYEFMQKGSLNQHLFGSSISAQSLEWNIRLKIAIGAAKGLSFLHMPGIHLIYRDFKTSHILLDGSYTAKISDFGLARLGPSANRSHVTTSFMGTYGYTAPEYVDTGHLYVQSDVYGYGVVLVEILTGLQAVDQDRPEEQHNLVAWVKPHLSDRIKLKNIMDHRLVGKYPFQTAFQIAQLALRCLELEPKNRPSMTEVVESLEQIQSSNENPKEPRNHSAGHATSRHGQQPLHH